MKKFMLIFFLITTSNVYSQTNASFFDGKSFQLEYFLKDGAREDFDFTHHQGQGTRNAPILEFSMNSATNLLETNTDGYCNGAFIEYDIFDDYLKHISGGPTTLADCGGDENTEFYQQISTPKVYFEFTTDQKGLWLWSEENHKLFFFETTLSIKENELEKAIAIYPNPSKEFVTINVISNTIEISNVSILDFQGRIIIEKRANFNKINISKLAKGIYFLKLKTDNNLSITKKLIVE